MLSLYELIISFSSVSLIISPRRMFQLHILILFGLVSCFLFRTGTEAIDSGFLTVAEFGSRALVPLDLVLVELACVGSSLDADTPSALLPWLTIFS